MHRASQSNYFNRDGGNGKEGAGGLIKMWRDKHVRIKPMQRRAIYAIASTGLNCRYKCQ